MLTNEHDFKLNVRHSVKIALLDDYSHSALLWTLTSGISSAGSGCLSDFSPLAKLFAGGNDSFPRQVVMCVTLVTGQNSITSTPSPTPLISSSMATILSSAISSSSSSVPVPSPSPSVCPAEGDMWPVTPAGTTRNGSCEEGSLEGRIFLLFLFSC